MTNFERIKAMTVEKMADFMTDAISECPYCHARKECERNIGCVAAFKTWLESEVQNDD